jgi:hypothetical protein
VQFQPLCVMSYDDERTIFFNLLVVLLLISWFMPCRYGGSSSFSDYMIFFFGFDVSMYAGFHIAPRT